MDEQVLGGRFELKRQIGAGGMARVFLAHDRLLAREVAVKILRPDAAADPAFAERFKREARAAAALNHPNVVSIYDWGTQNGVDYLVMEYVPGENLREVLLERGRLPEIEVLEIGAQVAAALEAAHRRGFIHRDVKPHNVLLDPDGRAKVTDFGIVRATGVTQLTSANAVCGTVQYLSPEQAMGKSMDQRSDLYSLGVVLYQLLTGEVPFHGDSPVVVALQHVHEAPLAPRRAEPAISPATEAVVLKALAKNPTDRYQTAQEMGLALQHARRLLVEAPPPGIPSPAASAMPTEQVRTPAAFSAPQETVRKPVVRPEPRRSTTDRRPWPLLMGLPVLLLAIAAGALFALRAGGSPSGGHRSALAPSTPRTVSHIKHKTRSAPATPATALPQPTATPQPAVAVPTATAPAPSPTPTIAPAAPPAAVVAAQPETSSGAATPEDAILTFYQLVSNHQFDQARQLWSAHMQATWDPYQNINLRFGDTQTMEVLRNSLVSRSDGRATVDVSLIEVKQNSSTIPITGSWQLVRGPNGWLLDQPDLRE